MKKAYITPTVKAITIPTEDLLCISLCGDATNSTALSGRRGSFGDDDEEW